jgi:hypothetical protein
MPQPLWKNAYVQNILIVVALFFFLYKLPTLLRNWNHPLVFFFGFMVHPNCCMSSLLSIQYLLSLLILFIP